MPTNPSEVPTQPTPGIWTPAELVMPTLEDVGIEPDRVITMSRLLKAVSEFMDVPGTYIDHEASALANTETVASGLFIPREDPRFRNAQNRHKEIIFPTEEFGVIARSPQDLARTVKRNTRKSFKVEEIVVEGGPSRKFVDKEGNPITRDEMNAAVERSAAHALGGFVDRIQTRIGEVSAERLALVALHKELLSGGYAHYKAENLNKLRQTGEHAVRLAVEVSAINTSLTSVSVDGLHKAVMYKIYGMPGHNDQRLSNFAEWVLMTGKWTRARLQALEAALRKNKREYALHEPWLATKVQPEVVEQA